MATTMRPSWYELRDAIAGRDFATAAATIQIDPALIKTTHGIGETALHFLAVENDAMGVAWLDEQGADINWGRPNTPVTSRHLNRSIVRDRPILLKNSRIILNEAKNFVA